MSYHETVRQDLYEGLTWALTDRRSLVDAADAAIRPLTLKTEDGRFVKVEQSGEWTHEGVKRTVYVVIEDQP